MGTIYSLCLSSDNTLLYSTSEDKTIRTWCLKSLEPLNSINNCESLELIPTYLG